MPSLAAFGKRFCQRVIRDLPEDLEAMECEDPLGLLRHHVPRLASRLPHDFGARQPAYARRPSFSIPGSPPTSRLRSPDGNISFHFAKNMVEDRSARGFDAYAREKGEADRLDEQSLDREQELAVAIDGAAKDAYIRGHGGRDGGAAIGWTNLTDPADWDVIEAFERDGRRNPDGNPPGLSIFYDRAPRLFDDVAQQAECPTGLRKVIALEQVRFASGRPPSARATRDGVRWIDGGAFDTYAWIRTRQLWPDVVDKDTRPVRVSEGRAVQTHVAGEGEYHADLGPEARGRIRTGMIDLVQRQRNAATDTAIGWFMPMTICDHEPDGLNDPLNNHFHWLTGTRRARYDENGGLEFEPKKVDAITRMEWILVMRTELARLTNIELAAIGAEVRYHPGTLAEMGVNAPAQQKMHGRRNVLERGGVSTNRGLSNDTEGWRRVFAEAERNHQSALTAIDLEAPASDEQYSHMRADRIEAARLRYEAAQIQILTDMSRSRAERTARFAPEYAASSRSTKTAAGWLARGKEAERHLRGLDTELNFERDAIARLRSQADRIEARAVASPARDRPPITVPAPAIVLAAPVVARRADAHRAADIIAKAPLFISDSDDLLTVAAVDDPDGLVRDIDLAGVQKRMAAIHAAQQRELAQVQAFVRRHGATALFDDDCDTHSPWFAATVRKWRDTPVMCRFVDDEDARVARQRSLDLGERHGRRAHLENRQIGEPDMVPSIADIPFLSDISGYSDLADERSASPPDRVPDASCTTDLQPTIVRSQRPIAPATSSRSALVWTDLERGHQEHIVRREQRDRKRVRQAIERAFAERVGVAGAVTPYAARLIAKVGKGFDPARVPTWIGPYGQTLDQRDAAELGVLSQSLQFRAQIEIVQRKRDGLARFMASAPPSATGADFLGRVAVDRGLIRFGPALTGGQTGFRTPLEWAEETVKRVIERQMPLTRQDGLIGIHDADVLRLSHDNYLGLLHPSVQHALDAQLRILAEVERDILRKVGTGALRLDIGIGHDRHSDAVTTHVRSIGGLPEDRAFVAQRWGDAAFYFRCRRAAAGPPSGAPPLRHESAVVRAWLEARDEGVNGPVLELLAAQVRKVHGTVQTSGGTDTDALALARLLAPRLALPAGRPQRGRGSRHRLPARPGSRDPSR